ncbi:PleD family two-component system response regulator [Aquamicrobium defluvii]|uniref:diguanylate cyclase n=1 Tax=Aquamicrobium defluvii TaxID=69279 RepID=A0A4V3DJP3_9HYPH|nr:PleD family two-component system response regulator [Aquamicrobium defluvii]TDR30872.1 response regulator receiver modulated diguanylate cyclase [Aquamicrobium defluvii]
MTARILVVDDIPANVRLLEVRLLAEYFEVVTANSGAEALEICETSKVDVVLLDVMMPEMDGFEVCRRLKSDPATAHLPVVMITALDQVTDRVRGLEAGADDFLTKPVNDLQLMTRVKSLVRLKMLTDELRLRTATAASIGLEDLLGNGAGSGQDPAKVLLIDARKQTFEKIRSRLKGGIELDFASDPNAGFFRAAEGGYECVIVSTALPDVDPLRLCSQLRSLDRTRFLPIILLADRDDDPRIIRGLELGVNDFLVRPVEPHELTARLTTQIRRKRYNDRLRASVAQSIEMAVTDALTGLHNRRYLDNHLQTLFERAVARRRPLSVMIVDLDRFKSINDRFGHDGGDDVLREFARRLRQNMRGIDLICRFGGEEFVVVMPDTDGPVAEKVAERIRAEIARTPFMIGKEGQAVTVTISVGVSSARGQADDVRSLLKRADMALYEAKKSGRNKVVGKAA